MQKTLFIADLHLDKRFPHSLAAFLSYLNNLKQQEVDALYILGDLFEYWLGDDCIDSTAKATAEALANYQHETNTPIYYIHGNRDFLLGQRYAERCNMQILPEHKVINLYGVKTLLLHGDTLCTDDDEYMHFREQVHQPEWQAKVLNLPVWVRRLKALHLRYRSKKANAEKSDAIMDVAQQTVEKMALEYQVAQLIHGHTHRPDIHHFDLSGQTAKRCVVGDWYTQGSILTVTATNIELQTLKFSK